MEKHKNNILVPTELGGDQSVALEQTLNLAKLTDSEITLLHVRRDTKTSIFYSFFNSKEEFEEMRQSYIETTIDKLNAIAKEAQEKSGVVIHTLLEKGKPSEVITEVANKISAKYIVMKLRSSATEKKDKPIGSNSLKVIRGASCPVISTNVSHVINEFKTIILPLDLSKDTRQKVTQAVKVAKLYDATIKICSVIVGEDREDVAHLELQDGQVAKFVKKSGVNCTTQLIYGAKNDKPSDLIIKYAEEQKGDIVMMMTQQETNLISSFVGSTVLNLIKSSPVPIMLINPIEVGVVGGFN